MTSSSTRTADPQTNRHRGAWRSRPNAPEPGTVLGAAQEVPEGGAREYRFGRGRSAFGMFVVRTGGSVRGYLNLCPHFSLPLNHARDHFVVDGQIMCFQHFARFRLQDGFCFEGACEGRHLDPVPVIERQGILFIGGGE